jgi:hypothetical protein
VRFPLVGTPGQPADGRPHPHRTHRQLHVPPGIAPVLHLGMIMAATVPLAGFARDRLAVR